LPANIDEGALVERILWKFGFDLPRYHSYQRIKQHLNEFRSTLLVIGDINTDEQREAVRKAGVNLFVYVEAFLEETICYPIWLLSCDHFLDTHLTYDTRYARRRVGQVLGSASSVSGITFQWAEDGGNALGTLLRYLQLACEWMKGLSVLDQSKLVRPEPDLPHYADLTDALFPFRHRELWADCNPSELARFIGEYESIVRLIAAERSRRD